MQSSDPNTGNEKSQPGRNWSRQSRRSAPSRIANLTDSHYLSVPIAFPVPQNGAATASGAQIGTTGASNSTRRRIPVVKSVDKRNFDLSTVNQNARRRKSKEVTSRQNDPFNQVSYGSDVRYSRRKSSVMIAPSVGTAESVVTRDPEEGQADDEGEDDIVFPPARAENLGTGRFFQTGTGDIGEVDDDGEDSDSSYASFTDLMQKKALFASPTSSDPDTLFTDGSDVTQTMTIATIDGTKPDAPTPVEDKSINPVVYRVYRSFYSGEIFSNGTLKASLKTGTNKKLRQGELTRPLFRWVHVENPSMNFANYAQFVLNIPWLTEGQRKIVDGILKTARTKSERSLNNIAGQGPGGTSSANTAKKGSYVEPEYYEESVKQTVYQGFRSRRQNTETIKWLCIPYFFVRDPEKDHATGGRKRGTTHSFPAEYSQPSFLLPPMDSGFVSEGSRFVVAQLWVLMIGESMIVTCARRGIEDLTRIRRSNELSENIIDVETLPPANPENRNVGDRAPVLIVSDGGIRTWLLPVDKCQHWPEFTANFAELGVDLFDGWDLLYQDYKLMSHDWPQLIARAKKSSVRLVLEKKDDDDDSSEDENSDDFESDEDEDEEATGDPLQPKVTTDSTGKPGTHDSNQTLSPEEVIEQWHVFTLLATTPAIVTLSESNSSHPHKANARLQVDDNILKEDADDVDHYLLNTNRRQGEKEAYKNLKGATYAEVREFAKTIKTDAEADPNGVNADRLRLVKSARHMFTFFYPLTFDHTVSQKYWGAVLRILQANQPNWAYFRSRMRRVRYIHHVVDNLKEELFSQRSPEYNTTNVPHEFIQAWLMLLMFLVMFTTDEAKRTLDYTKRCRSLLAQGKFKVIRRLQTVSLREKEAVLPLGVASLLIGKLLENARGDQDFTDRQRLLTGYFGDLQKLTERVRDDPLSRKYQDEFVNMKTELESVLATIDDQQRVLVALDDGITELETKSVVAPEGQENTVKSRESIVMETTLENLEQTLFSFVQMERRRAELEAWHFRTIEIDKDNQEKAALAFTTVTVLFLPLTLLASIFGMNTNDIRNMNQDQRLFWYIATPMCIGFLALWLAYLGTLKVWWRRIRHLSRK